MRINKITTILFILLTYLTNQSSANISDASWYVSVDVQKVNSTEIYKLIPADTYGTAPKNISHITLYGDASGIENATAVIQGDFTNQSLDELIINNFYTVNGVSPLVKGKVLNYKNHSIDVLKIENKYDFEGKYKLIEKQEDTKSFYFSQINNGLGVVSFDINEVKNWIDNKYDNLDIKHESLFSVVVDVQSALAHMGMNIDENNHMMQSEIFQKVIQASASVSEVNSDIFIDVALTTSNEETAILIEQVINGLVAMSNLSGANDKNELHAILIQNLSIERDVGNILISSYAAVEDIKKLKVKRHSYDDNQKVKIKRNALENK